MSLAIPWVICLVAAECESADKGFAGWLIGSRIAHEIKNPLNFVNNFAGPSVELLDELKEAASPAMGNYQVGVVRTVAHDGLYRAALGWDAVRATKPADRLVS